MRALKQFLLHLDDYLAMMTLVVIILITVSGVFMRYVVGEPFKWTEEMLKALVVWFTFLGASSVMRDNDHISIDVLVRRLPKGLQYALVMFRMIIMTSVLIFLFVWGMKLLFIAWLKITPTLHIRYTFIDIVVPCTALAMIFHLFRSFYRCDSSGDNERSDSGGGAS